MMHLMAIDPGTKEMGIMFTGSAPFTMRPANSNAIRPHRLSSLMVQLRYLFEHEARDVDTVIFERPFARGRDATRCLWGLAGIIEAVATFNGCATLDITPSTLTSWALGKQTKKRNKNPMIELASTMGYGALNEHEADALMLYHYGLQNIRSGELK